MDDCKGKKQSFAEDFVCDENGCYRVKPVATVMEIQQSENGIAVKPVLQEEKDDAGSH